MSMLNNDFNRFYIFLKDLRTFDPSVPVPILVLDSRSGFPGFPYAHHLPDMQDPGVNPLFFCFFCCAELQAKGFNCFFI